MLEIEVSDNNQFAKQVDGIKKAANSAQKACGFRAMTTMQNFIAGGVSPELRAMTRQLSKRKNTKPPAWYRRFIRYKQAGDKIEVGLPPKNPFFAYLQRSEEGETVAVTPKMRRYLAVRGFPIRRETKSLKVPARKIMEPMKKIIEAMIPKAFEEKFIQKIEQMKG